MCRQPDVIGLDSTGPRRSWPRLYSFHVLAANRTFALPRTTMRVAGEASVMLRTGWLVATALVVGCGGDTTKPRGTASPQSTPAAVSEDDVAKHNRAVAHVNRNEIKEAEAILKDLADRYPDNETIAVDYAIAVMHRHKGGTQAIPIFEADVERFPNSDRARYGLAYLYSLAGRAKEAIDFLKPVAEKTLDGKCTDPHVAYLYGKTLDDAGATPAEVAKWLQKAVDLDPYFYTAAYSLLRPLQATKRPPEEIRAMTERADRLRNHAFGTVADERLRRMGPMLDVIPLENRAATPAAAPTGDVFLEPVGLVTNAEWGKAAPSKSASITVCDINGDGLLDLFIADANVTVGGKSVPNAVLLQDEGRKFRLATDHPLAAVSNVTAALWGDIDNDGLTDVFLCRRGGNQLWRQTARGKWAKVSDPGLALGPQGDCRSGVLFDADFDGDLDVFLVYDGSPNELLQNPGNGIFKSMGKALGVAGPESGAVQALAADLNGDRMPDLVVLTKGRAVEVFKPDLKTGFAPAPEIARPEGAVGAVVSLATPLNGASKLLAAKQAEGAVRLELADVTGDGVLARFESIDGVLCAVGADAESRTIKLPALPKTSAWPLANLDPKHGPALVCLPTDGGPPVAAHPGPGRFDFFSLSFIGDEDGKKHIKSNRAGIGVKVCARIRDAWLCQYPLSQSSGPGQSLQPMAFGTRGAAAADFLFIDWPNGDFQSEFSPPIGKTVAIKELDRVPIDSCPLLFCWNGTKYDFITDFLGVGGVDYLVRPGEYYTPADPTEHLLLPPGVASLDGLLKLKVLEPAEEITFLDRASLAVYDLPPGWSMTLDERHSALPPKPTHEPRFYRTAQTPIRATNESGVDCTVAVKHADLKAAPAPPADLRFNGRYERPHILTLEFASPIDALAKPNLMMDGWVAFPDAQSAVNATQAGVEFSAPRLEAAGPDGKWSVIYPEFGYPAGMQRQMSLPLERLPKSCTKLRITHSLEAHWDRVALVDAQPCPTLHKTAIGATVAALAHVGVPRYDRDRDGKPYWFNYDDRNPFWPPRAPTGAYTRFGDCKELIDAADDASATIGPGEEVHLEFKTPPAPPAGWTRRYVLESRGWCRGMRLYTRNGSTVEPYPTSGLPAEPRNTLHHKYNTRHIGPYR